MATSTKKEKKRMPLTPVGRVSFESVFKPSAMEEGQEKKYGVTLLIPKTLKGEQAQLFKEMKLAAEKLCKEKFGCGLNGKYKGKPIKSPFRDGEEKEHLDGYDSSVWFVRFSGRMKPSVVGPDKSAIGSEDGEFYNGCYGRVSYTVYSYTKVNNGIAFGLVNVQKTKDGEAFGAGGSDPDDDFDEVEDDDRDESDAADEAAELEEALED